MSMLSAQCDELRELADQFQLCIEKGWDAREEATRALPLLRRAADTIWELRCKLNGTYFWTPEGVRRLVERCDHGGIQWHDRIDWETIANELNHRDPMSERTCRMVSHPKGGAMTNSEDQQYCSECGARWPTRSAIEARMKMAYCNNCGKKVTWQ